MQSAPKPRLSKRERTAILVLLLLLPVLTIAVIGNQQIFNAYLVWAQDQRQPRLLRLPTADDLADHPRLNLVRKLSRRRGCLLATVVEEISGAGRDYQDQHRQYYCRNRFLSLAAGAAIAAGIGRRKFQSAGCIAFHLLNSIGFANVFPVSLALYARVAPAALSATIIGIYYLAFFAANNLVGWIGGFLEKMPATNFWLLHSALCGTAGIIFFVAGRFFGHLLAPGDQESPANA